MEQMPKAIEDWRVVLHDSSNFLLTLCCLGPKGGTQDEAGKEIAFLKSKTPRPVISQRLINKVWLFRCTRHLFATLGDCNELKSNRSDISMLSTMKISIKEKFRLLRRCPFLLVE